MQIQYQIQKYIDSMATFEGISYGGIDIDMGEISSRVIEIGIPPGPANAEQAKVLLEQAIILRNMEITAQSMGIELKIIVWGGW